MQFEEYVLACVRGRPDGLDWVDQVFYAVLGLVSETTRLVEVTSGWQAVGEVAAASQRALACRRFEQFRALTYYQLDLRPDHLGPWLDPFAACDEPAVGLAVQVGRIAALVSGWMYRGSLLDARLRDVLRRFEFERRRMLQQWHIDERTVWGLDQIDEVPRSPLRRHAHGR